MARKRRIRVTQKGMMKPVLQIGGGVANEFAADFLEQNVGFFQTNRQFLQPTLLALGLAGQFFLRGEMTKNFFEGMTVDAGKETVRVFTPLLQGALGQTPVIKKMGVSQGLGQMGR